MTLTRPGDQHWRMWHESTAAPAVLVCLLSRSYQGQHRPVLHQNNGNKVIWRSRTIRHRHAHYDVVFVCIELPTRCSRYFFLFCCFFSLQIAKQGMKCISLFSLFYIDISRHMPVYHHYHHSPLSFFHSMFNQ